MTARDASMTLDEFKHYCDSHRGVISSIKAYDAAVNKWAGMDELLQKPGAYTLIVVKFRNNSFLRVNVKPSLTVRMSPGTIASPATWQSAGINITFEEKAFLNTIKGDLSLGELIAAVESSSFEGREALAQKLKKASGRI